MDQADIHKGTKEMHASVDSFADDEKPVDNQLLDSEGHIYLIPTPTEDPADPLNWHPVRKVAILILLVLWSASALSIQAFLLNYLPSVEKRFPEASLGQINMLVTLLMVMVAPGQLFFTPLAIACGRRISLLLANALLVASYLWGAFAKSYTSLLGARIVEGLAGGPTDCMVYVMVSEFTFIHQRGAALGIVMGGQLALELGLAIATNYMAVVYDFKSPFLMFTGVSAGTLIGFFLVMPETRYDRTNNALLPKVKFNEYADFKRNLVRAADGQFEPYTLRRQLSVWSGLDLKSLKWFFKRMAKHSLSPTMWWNAGINTVTSGSVLAASTYYATMLVSPPWNWPAQNVGLINIGPVIMAVVNWFLLGWGNDKVLIWLAKRNNNISRQEHRLVVLVLPIITGVISSVAFGFLAQHYLVTNPGGNQPHWFSIVFILALCYQSFCGVIEVTLTYLANTTSPEDSLAVMTLVSVLRDTISFGMSYGVVSFSTCDGFATSFGIYGLLIGIFGLLLIPVYMYADWCREKLGLQLKS